VLCERFADSSMAYQGYGRERIWAAVRLITQFATEGLYLTSTVYLDLRWSGIERKQVAHATQEVMESARPQVWTSRRVCQGYLQIQADPGRWLVLTQRIHGRYAAVIRKRLELDLIKPER